ncbi:MAG: signal peptidase II [Eubacteriales bacterium]|nr:signal peptidase II [Eubacteriales bacterium]
MRKNKKIPAPCFYLLISGLILLLTLLDQASKLWAAKRLRGREDISVIQGVFRLSYLENRGAAFGILQNQLWIFLLFSVLLLGTVVYLFIRMPHTGNYLPLHLAAAVLAAGGIGNTLDRLFRGYVVDFLYFSLIDFPVFNVADIYVVLSILSICLLVFFYYPDENFEFLFLKKKRRS